MSQINNPFPRIAEATDAATKVVGIQAELFVLEQELRTMKKLRAFCGVVVSGLFGVLALIFTTFWVTSGLHENGWGSYQLALLTAGVFGLPGLGLWLTAKRAVRPKGPPS